MHCVFLREQFSLKLIFPLEQPTTVSSVQCPMQYIVVQVQDNLVDKEVWTLHCASQLPPQFGPVHCLQNQNSGCTFQGGHIHIHCSRFGTLTLACNVCEKCLAFGGCCLRFSFELLSLNVCYLMFRLLVVWGLTSWAPVCLIPASGTAQMSIQQQTKNIFTSL